MRVKLDLSTIQANDTIIVANNRQAIAFKQTIFAQLGPNKMPNIYPYPAFLKHLWGSLNPQSKVRVLSDSELRAMIGKFLYENNVNNVSALTKEVIKCYRLMKAYFIDERKIASYQNSANTIFLDCLNQLNQTKKKYQLIDSTDIFSKIISSIEGLYHSGATFHFGIKHPTPEQEKLFSALQSQALRAAETNSKTQATSHPTLEAELQEAAKWSKVKNKAKPSERIAIVIPNLNELQHKVRSIFDEAFESHGKETQVKPYNISLGVPLLSYTLIRHVFKIIELSNDFNKGVVELSTLMQVIPSPYIGGASSEENNRALLVVRLLSFSKNRLNVKHLLKLMEPCPILLEKVLAITRIQHGVKETPERWLEIFYQFLNAVSFGVDRPLSSCEYQLFEKFQNESLLLNQISKTHNTVSFNHCIEQLKNHFNSIIFQPKSGPANIHILGALEAEGLNFDAAWISGMNSNFLPGFVKFPLFIPASICAEFKLPFSSFEQIQKNANDTLQELNNLSGNVRFSFAQTIDGREQIATHLINFETYAERKKHTPQCLTIKSQGDCLAPQLKYVTIKQGVQTLQDQMSCPFKGFVRRLKIKEFEPEHLGFNRAEQGTLLHTILETLFSEITSSIKLKELSDHGLNQLIEKHTNNAIGRIEKNHQALEQRRLTRIIAKYLELEKQRVEFEVEATESVVDVCIEGLKFTTKLDRMDRLPTGDRLIIDYKTGQSALSQITGKTIEQAQLPIYAISNQVDGVAFGQINASECSFKAITKDSDCLPASKQSRSKMPDWFEQLNRWEGQLNKASVDFQQGVACVTPEKKACDYCDYDLLCRVEKTLNHC